MTTSSAAAGHCCPRGRVLGFTAYVVAAALLLAGSRRDNLYLSAGLMAASGVPDAAFGQQSNWWSSVIEVSGRHALFGLMNGIGILGAMSSQFFFGSFADWRRPRFTGRDHPTPPSTSTPASSLVSATRWLFVDTSKVVGGGEAESPGEPDRAADHA